MQLEDIRSRSVVKSTSCSATPTIRQREISIITTKMDHRVSKYHFFKIAQYNCWT